MRRAETRKQETGTDMVDQTTESETVACEDAPLGAPIGRLGRLPVFQATGFAGGT